MNVSGNITPNIFGTGQQSQMPISNISKSPAYNGVNNTDRGFNPTMEIYEHEMTNKEQKRKVVNDELFKYQMERDSVYNELAKCEASCKKSVTMIRRQQQLSGQLKEIDQKVNDLKTYMRD